MCIRDSLEHAERLARAESERISRKRKEREEQTSRLLQIQREHEEIQREHEERERETVADAANERADVEAAQGAANGRPKVDRHESVHEFHRLSRLDDRARRRRFCRWFRHRVTVTNGCDAGGTE